MTPRRVFGVLVLAAVAAVQGAAQDAVTIKFADAKAGDKSRVTEEETATTTTTFQVGGKDQKKEEKFSKTFVYVDEVVTAGAGAGKKALKSKRTYEKAEITKDGKAEDAGVVGKTVLIEKKGDKYEFTVDGKALTGPVARELDRVFNQPDGPGTPAFFPETPVKPGDSWKIDPKKALAGLSNDNIQIDIDKATATGKLTKTYKKDGATFGVFEVKAELPIKGLGPKTPVTVKPASTMSMTITGDGNIDGTMTAGSQQSKMKITIEGSTMGIDLVVVANVEQKKSSVPLGK